MKLRVFNSEESLPCAKTLPAKYWVDFRDLKAVLNSYFSTLVLASFWHFPGLFTLHEIETNLKASFTPFKERFHYFTFLGRKNKTHVIFEVSENNIKIVDILFSEKLHVRFDEIHFEDPMQGSCT